MKSLGTRVLLAVTIVLLVLALARGGAIGAIRVGETLCIAWVIYFVARWLCMAIARVLDRKEPRS